MLGVGDGIKVAPPRREVLGICVDDGVQLPIEKRIPARRHRPHFGNARVNFGIVHAQLAQNRHATRKVCAARAGDQRKIGIADRRCQLGECGAVLVDVRDDAVAGEGNGGALDDVNPQSVGQLLFYLDAANPLQR